MASFATASTRVWACHQLHRRSTLQHRRLPTQSDCDHGSLQGSEHPSPSRHGYRQQRTLQHRLWRPITTTDPSTAATIRVRLITDPIGGTPSTTQAAAANAPRFVPAHLDGWPPLRLFWEVSASWYSSVAMNTEPALSPIPSVVHQHPGFQRVQLSKGATVTFAKQAPASVQLLPRRCASYAGIECLTNRFLHTQTAVSSPRPDVIPRLALNACEPILAYTDSSLLTTAAPETAQR